MANPVKVSFKQVGSSQAAPVDAEIVPNVDSPAGAPESAPQPDVSAALAPRPADSPAVQEQRPAYTFGGEDEVDAGDIRYPRLNLVQKSSSVKLNKLGLGQFVLNQELALGEKFTSVVVGFGPLRYIEKTKYTPGVSSNSRIFNSIQEVEAAGGTTEWRESKENQKIKSTKPWFMKSRTALILIEKPEGVSDERFTFVAGGKAFAAALFAVKSTSYESFYVKLNSEQKTGTLREGFSTRFVEASSVLVPFSGGEAYQPQVKVAGGEAGKVPAEIVALAQSLRG